MISFWFSQELGLCTAMKPLALKAVKATNIKKGMLRLKVHHFSTTFIIFSSTLASHHLGHLLPILGWQVLFFKIARNSGNNFRHILLLWPKTTIFFSDAVYQITDLIIILGLNLSILYSFYFQLRELNAKFVNMLSLMLKAWSIRKQR